MRVLLLAYRLHDLFLAADVGVVDLDHMLAGWLVASFGRLPNPFVASRGPGLASLEVGVEVRAGSHQAGDDRGHRDSLRRQLRAQSLREPDGGKLGGLVG